MSFLLKNLELALAEEFLLVGEKHLEEGKVKNLHESQRHLWIAEVEQYETEMQITPSRVKAVTCDCESYHRSKMCAHLAASLLALRSLLSNHKVHHEKKEKSKEEYAKLTIAAVLENVTQADLVAFVRRYAKTNRNFALALKARFAAAVPTGDSKEKYIQLLDSAIQPSRKKNDRIGALGAYQLAMLTADLLGQADDAIALGYFSEAAGIFRAVIEKIHPVIFKCEGDPEHLLAHLSACFDGLEKLAEVLEVPSLRENLWQFCLEKSNHPAYRQYGFTTRFFDLLKLLAEDEHKRQSLLSAIDKVLKDNVLNEDQKTYLLLIKWQVLNDLPGKDKFREFMLDLIAKPELLSPLLESAVADLRLNTAKDVALKALRLTPAIFHASLREVLLKIAMLDNDAPAVVEFAASQFLETLDITYFKQCKQYFRGDWAAFLDPLIFSLKNEPLTNDKTEALAQLFVLEGKHLALLELLKERQSLKLLMKFDKELLLAHRREVYNLYEAFLLAYLGNHVGRIPSQKTAEVLSHLHRSGASDLAGKLAETIRKAFSKRSSLMEKLGVF